MARELVREIDGKLCLSSQALQDVFAVTGRTLGNWAQQGCPKVRAGWWPLAEVIKWKGLGGGSTTRDGGDDSGLSDGQLKLKYDAEVKRLQAQQLELKNAIALGEYLSRDEVIGTLTPYFAELKRSLVAFSRTIAMEVAQFVDPVSARRIGREFDELTADFLRRIATGAAYDTPKRRKGKTRKG